ncbi:MAG: hypothetical protein KFBDDELM_00103 [Candidatus Argoarchaeum ethanivorans]|uniref:Uncharacterized protein n=1 Tax=Candidatus Argoarchaeum ethanivorans TaxID=2608793 RepID=A0A811T8F1_9EURY|nr:MAG: hypothetical protein KFBDDELM_00103 [Candidatus Argoarchaeum ethanivorans]CAD6493574.1 MAG: hypothetical protein FFODKBPE_00522 [Candidatus Argoarchaeum ethanivorans]
MIFPQDYKYVGITDTPPQKGGVIYFSTQYLIVETTEGEHTDYQIYLVKNNGKGLLRTITDITLLADTHQITVLNETVDSCNFGALVKKARKLCSSQVNTVLITARDKHTTFIHEPDISELFEIEIIDIVPPNPPWLIYTTRRLYAAGVWSRLPICFSEKEIDLAQFQDKNTMFPCTSSGLKGTYLDAAKTTPDGTTLVGCDISYQIFNIEFTNKLKKHINICPLKKKLYMPTKPFITRCCQSEKTGLTTVNNMPGVIVHWGASEYDVIEAVRHLYKHCKGEL